MRNKVLDLLFDIKDFKNTEELIIALNSYSPLMSKDTDRVLNGFYLVLKELAFDSSYQRHTLLATMVNVKRNYGMLTYFTHTVEQMNAITLAITHVKDCLRTQRNEVESVELCEQQKKAIEEENRIFGQLANDIRMLFLKARGKDATTWYTPVERKPIWALKVKGKDSEGSEPFIAGYKIKQVAMLLGMSSGSVRNALKNNIVKGYKLYYVD
ncbi:hypothetical protein [Bacillus sp. FJAT-29814]|uniref:hypothetical protein n=1 Tax=Bacillus sp. FJAT-29814 TaxID=1729688 RepID=UPI000830868D|nr:hypothetical protein [Bacillus sp. FJAT-29814]